MCNKEQAWKVFHPRWLKIDNFSRLKQGVFRDYYANLTVNVNSAFALCANLIYEVSVYVNNNNERDAAYLNCIYYSAWIPSNLLFPLVHLP